MAYFYLLAALAVVVWLVAVGCGLASLRLGWQPRRFALAVVLAAVALGVGLLGRTFHLTYSQAVNGRGWRVDSSWFFWVPLIVGGIALALALWRRFTHLQVNPPPIAGPVAQP